MCVCACVQACVYDGSFCLGASCLTSPGLGITYLPLTKIVKTSLLLFQLEMQVCDGGCPSRCSTQLLRVNVNRNRQRPTFSPVSYTATISEEALLGSSVLTVVAVDNDFIVSTVLHLSLFTLFLSSSLMSSSPPPPQCFLSF